MDRTRKMLMGTLIGAWGLFVAVEAAGSGRGTKGGGLFAALKAARSVLMFILIVINALMLMGNLQKQG